MLFKRCLNICGNNWAPIWIWVDVPEPNVLISENEVKVGFRKKNSDLCSDSWTQSFVFRSVNSNLSTILGSEIWILFRAHVLEQKMSFSGVWIQTWLDFTWPTFFFWHLISILSTSFWNQFTCGDYHWNTETDTIKSKSWCLKTFLIQKFALLLSFISNSFPWRTFFFQKLTCGKTFNSKFDTL